MTKTATRYPTFTDEQRANTVWIVCHDAFVPVASVELAQRIIAELPCANHHEAVILNLRSVTYTEVWTHWKDHAYSHSANMVAEHRPVMPWCSGVVSRGGQGSLLGALEVVLGRATRP